MTRSIKALFMSKKTQAAPVSQRFIVSISAQTSDSPDVHVGHSPLHTTVEEVLVRGAGGYLLHRVSTKSIFAHPELHRALDLSTRQHSCKISGGLDVQLFKDEAVKVEHPMPARVQDPHPGPLARIVKRVQLLAQGALS